MDTYECIKKRRSIRKYMNVPVPWEFVSKILDAGRLAPSAGNLQNWKFVTVLNEDSRKGLAEAAMQQYWMANAPVHIVVVAEPEKGKRYYGIRGERLYTTQACAAAAENMLLAAENFGLGGCWVGGFDEEMVKRTLSMPEEVRPQMILTFGYPDEEPEMPLKYPIEIVMYFDVWRKKIQDVAMYMGEVSTKIEELAQKGKGVIEKGKEVLAAKTQKLAEKVSDKLKERADKKKGEP
jgi:nitroreductase